MNIRKFVTTKAEINMEKHFFLVMFFLLIFWIIPGAQPTPPALRKKIAGLTNLKAIMTRVEAYYHEEEEQEKKLMRLSHRMPAEKEDEAETFESGLLFWKRWEYYNQTRLKPNGDVQDVTTKTIAAWEKVKAKYENSARLQSGTNAQWSFVGPLTNSYTSGEIRGISRVDRIVFHPTDANTFYACCNNGGLWQTTNGGISWVNLTFNFPILSVSGLAINPANTANMWVITGDGKSGNKNACGIWVTYDGGSNWIKTNFNTDLQTAIYDGFKIVLKPGSSTILFAACNTGLYRSTDGGINWTPKLPGALFNGNRPIYDIEFAPADPNYVYASGYGTFYRSASGGDVFSGSVQPPFAGAERIEIGVSPNKPNYVYALCGGYAGAVTVGNPPVTTYAGTSMFRGIYRSDDKGFSFTPKANTPNILCDAPNGVVSANDALHDQSNYDLAIDVDKNNAETVIVGGKIIWKSTNGGTSFTNLTPYWQGNSNPIPPANYIHPDIQDIAYNPLNGYLYSGTDGGLYRSTDNGTTWTDLTSGIRATTFYHMAGAPFDANKILAGAQDNGLKYKKNAGDLSHIESGDGFSASFGPTATSSIYATINETFYRHSSNGVFESNNTPANTAFFPLVIADPVNNGVIYLAGATNHAVGANNVPLPPCGIQKSTNGGNSWAQVSASLITRSMNISPANAARIYVAGESTILRSDNAGATWSGNLASNAGFPNNAGITAIFACPTNSDFVYVTTGGYTANQKVYYSGNAGASWVNISGTIPAELYVNCIVVDNGNNAYIGTEMGVYYQAVYSTDWTPYYNGLPRCTVSDLVINQNAAKIRAATFGQGVWETSLYAACDAFYTVSGNVTGTQFYQVSNTLTVNANITGGDATRVVAKAAAKVVLSDGFRAYEHNNFRTLIGACESGPVPQPYRMGRGNDLPPAFMSQADKGNSNSLFAYGTVSVTHGKKTGTAITLHTIKTGFYTVRITNAGGEMIKSLLNEQMAENRLVVKPVTGLPQGKYYVQLLFENLLVHYQELVIR